jgi:DNA-directed RNA polymerase specialized sigma24 family protein
MRLYVTNDMIDGKSDHDFAMDSVMETGQFNPTNIHRRIIDAIRRVKGRGGRRGRSWVRIPNGMRSASERMTDADALDAFRTLGLDGRNLEIAMGLWHGLTARAISRRIGVTETAVGNRLRKMRDSIPPYLIPRHARDAEK